jgi:hypothetical protein
MLDPIFKSLRLIYFFIGCEHQVVIIEKYGKKSLFPMLLKFYCHLHPLSRAKSSLACKFDENMNLDVFEMVVGINELVKEFINSKLLIFCKSQVDVKNIKCPFGVMEET